MSNKFEALKANDDSGNDETQSKDNQKAEKDSPPPIEVNPNEHKLQYAYALWYSRRNTSKQSSIQSYDQNLKLVGRFATVEQFWSLYSHLVRPSELAALTDFHLFKVGIKPMWEMPTKVGARNDGSFRDAGYIRHWYAQVIGWMPDISGAGTERDEANQKGGKWIVRLRKGLVSRCWENLILAILGEQFMVGEEICGAVVSIRFPEDIICVWNKTASDYATTAHIRDTLRRVLHLPASASMEYKTHNESLKNVHRL